jgi:hypothetical protein
VVYGYERRDDTGEGRAHLDIHRWKAEETIIGSWTISEGTLVVKHVRVVGGSLPLGYRVDTQPAFLIRGDCLYSDAYRRGLLFPSRRGKDLGCAALGRAR